MRTGHALSRAATCIDLRSQGDPACAPAPPPALPAQAHQARSPSSRSTQTMTLPSCPALASVFIGRPKLGAQATSRTQSAAAAAAAAPRLKAAAMVDVAGARRGVEAEPAGQETPAAAPLENFTHTQIAWLGCLPGALAAPAGLTCVPRQGRAVLLPLPRLVVVNPHLGKAVAWDGCGSAGSLASTHADLLANCSSPSL